MSSSNMENSRVVSLVRLACAVLAIHPSFLMADSSDRHQPRTESSREFIQLLSTKSYCVRLEVETDGAKEPGSHWWSSSEVYVAARPKEGDCDEHSYFIVGSQSVDDVTRALSIVGPLLQERRLSVSDSQELSKGEITCIASGGISGIRSGGAYTSPRKKRAVDFLTAGCGDIALTVEDIYSNAPVIGASRSAAIRVDVP